MSYVPDLGGGGASEWLDEGADLIPIEATDNVKIPAILRFINAAYNQSRMTFEIGGNIYHLWMDTAGVLRIKLSAPSSDKDGTPLVGNLLPKVVDVSAQIGDGDPDIFSVAPDTFVAGSVEVIRNGLWEPKSSLSEIGDDAVQLAVTPLAGELVEVRFLKKN